MLRSKFPWLTTVLGALLIFFLPYVTAWIDSKSLGSMYSLIPLVLVNPAVYIFASIYVYARYGRKVMIPIGVYLVTTLLSVFITYNETARIYVVFYVILAGIAVGLTEISQRSIRHFRRSD